MVDIKNSYVNGRENSSNKVVTIIEYLLGVSEKVLNTYCDAETVAKIADRPAAQIVRALSIVRMSIFKNFDAVDYDLKYNMKNLDVQEHFASEVIATLCDNNVPLLKTNYDADAYIRYVTELLSKHIDECKDLFPSCIEFSYIKKLFIPKGYSDTNVRKREMRKYIANMPLYPIGLYICWEPKDRGNILLNDEKFLTILYQENKDKFNKAYLFKDVSQMAKGVINDFIAEAEKVIFAVDCENVDPYKLFGMISSLSSKVRNKIGEVILYDDVNANVAWGSFENLVSIPVTHIRTVRVLEHKSVVDAQLIMGVMKACYESSTDSVVLCSSDSDFLPLIQVLKDIKFMVLYEKCKCSNVTIGNLKNNGVPFYALDNFYQADNDELQKSVFIDSLKKLLPTYIGRKVEDLFKAIQEETHQALTDVQMKKYYDTYLKKIRLDVNEDGVLSVSVG